MLDVCMPTADCAMQISISKQYMVSAVCRTHENFVSSSIIRTKRISFKHFDRRAPYDFCCSEKLRRVQQKHVLTFQRKIQQRSDIFMQNDIVHTFCALNMRGREGSKVFQCREYSCCHLIDNEFEPTIHIDGASHKAKTTHDMARS